MASFLVVFYEKDRRQETPDKAWQVKHKQSWKAWLEAQIATGTLQGGKSLELEGTVIRRDGSVQPGPYFHGTEMVGGFLLLEAKDLAEATNIAASCPIFEAGGFAEVRTLAGSS